MKHIKVKENVVLQGEEAFYQGNRVIKYYLTISENKKVFAFQRKFSRGTYELCIRVNELTTLKSRDTGVMNLVKHVNVTLPYLVDYYQIPVCA